MALKHATPPVSKKIIIIGSGFSSLSAACYLAKEGYQVVVYEKNGTLGGRARQLKKHGFTFDMGPTFYWMPDIIERFFVDFGTTPAAYYTLTRLDPGYEVYFEKANSIRLAADFEKIKETFEAIEPNSGRFLARFIQKAAYNYRIAIDQVVYKPGKSPFELVMPATIAHLPSFFFSLKREVRTHVKHPALRQILEFPVLFLGAKPADTPAFYCFMNYADMILGTWHIQGGMFELVKAMSNVARQLGVQFRTGQEVEKIVIDKKTAKASGVLIKNTFHPADLVVSGADYHHTESLIDPPYRNYDEAYWNKRVLAPSALLYYIGFGKKIKRVSHHTLFFDADFDRHAAQIYDTPGWPDAPLFYASFPTRTDARLGPPGQESAILLIPVAPGLPDTPEIRRSYLDQMLTRMEYLTDQSLKEDVLFSESYAVDDFSRDYHAYKGNAYGLSNILSQTAFLKPKMQNKKIRNLIYTGQFTVPGPGVPTTIISGNIAARSAIAYFRQS